MRLGAEARNASRPWRTLNAIIGSTAVHRECLADFDCRAAAGLCAYPEQISGVRSGLGTPWLHGPGHRANGAVVPRPARAAHECRSAPPAGSDAAVAGGCTRRVARVCVAVRASGQAAGIYLLATGIRTVGAGDSRRQTLWTGRGG